MKDIENKIEIIHMDDEGKLEYTYEYKRGNIETVRVSFLGKNDTEKSLQQIVENRIKNIWISHNNRVQYWCKHIDIVLFYLRSD